MKLVIEIDEGTYESAKEMSETSIDEYKAMRAIANGTPLDSVLYDIKAEIENIPNNYATKPVGTYDYCWGAKNERKVILSIIDNYIGKE